tara:strand:- start:418 stop:1806 length:1389 start_codon:yes stop_codon:yes gene_type:complete
MNKLRTYHTKANLFLVILLLCCSSLFAQKEQPLTRVLFIFDASQSMYSNWEGGSRMDIAKNLLSNMLDSLRGQDKVEVALRVYGHQRPVPPQDCRDTRLEVGFSNNIQKIQARLQTIRPKGTTPIANALEAGAYDFPKCDDCRNIVILITDGIEECGGDPCAVSRLYQEKRMILKPFVIGIGLDDTEELTNEEYKKTFECVGTYYDAKSPETFKNVLQVVISQVLNSTTAQVNLLDKWDNPTETNVPISFYDSYSGILQYNFIHTQNSKGNPDTLNIDPVLSYRVVAHTIPKSEAKGEWKLTPGEHTIIPINAAQGKLKLTVSGNTSIKCIIRKKDELATLNIQEFNTKQKYLIGDYDIEILSLPRIKETVEINQSKTTNIAIPEPGLVILSYPSVGYGSIFLDNSELEWVCDISEEKTKETIQLLPGKYRVIFRSKNANQSVYTKEQQFTVTSRKSVSVKL